MATKSTLRYATEADADRIDAIMGGAYPGFLSGGDPLILPRHAFLKRPLGLSAEALAERKKRLIASIGEYRVALRNDVVVGSMHQKKLLRSALFFSQQQLTHSAC